MTYPFAVRLAGYVRRRLGLSVESQAVVYVLVS